MNLEIPVFYPKCFLQLEVSFNSFVMFRFSFMLVRMCYTVQLRLSIQHLYSLTRLNPVSNSEAPRFLQMLLNVFTLN